MSYRRPAGLLLAFGLLLAPPLLAQTPDSSLVTLDRLFDSEEFAPDFLGAVRWIVGEAAYTKLEPDSATPPGRALVRYDAASGRRDVWVPAARLVPPGDSLPLVVEDYALSPDRARLLLFTNSRKVWRQNTRGDFWTLDLATWRLRQLGGPDAAPSTLMFAKFSPDGGRVAYVREHNLYVERLGDGRITQLTRDGSRTIINGTFDWVYEEELNLRDGFRWSPDGRRIAFWQLDASGVRDFDLINDTDSLYSFVVPVQYPKAGTTNSAARAGVVSADGGEPVWLDLPGDPRNNYIARLEWAASSDELVLEHMNRAQNTIAVMLGDARSGRTRTVLTERDSAWVDVVDDLRWINGGKDFTWISERDGWRHLYVVSRDGRKSRLVTPAAFDLHNPKSAFGAPYVVGVDSAAGWIYYTASPDDATQLYLYRSRLDGTGKQQRVTPKDQPGYHLYDISKDGRWAFHSYSRLGTPPVVDLVRLPTHEIGADGGGQPPAARRHRPAPTRAGRVREGGRGQRPPAGRLGHEAAGLRLHQAVPGALPGLRRARRPDRPRPVGRRLPLVSDADAARLRGGVGRQPRDPRAARPRLPEGDLQAGRPGQFGRPGRGRADHANGGRGWTRRASASGAGVAVARRRST